MNFRIIQSNPILGFVFESQFNGLFIISYIIEWFMQIYNHFLLELIKIIFQYHDLYCKFNRSRAERHMVYLSSKTSFQL